MRATATISVFSPSTRWRASTAPRPGGAASPAAVGRPLVLDGVPQADPFGGWVAFPAYLPERLAAARVTRGGGSGYTGPGALAGTIELFSGTTVYDSESVPITLE